MNYLPQKFYRHFTKMKVKCLEKQEVPGLFITSAKLGQSYTSYLSKTLGRTV